MANATSVLVEQRVVAFALGHPGFGPARIAVELAQPRWVASSCRPTGSGGCCAATACPPGPSATAWWPAMPRHRPLSGRHHHPSSTSRSTIPASWSSWTVSASAGCRAPTAPCGSTPPSTSLRPLPGRASRSLGATLSPMDQRPGPPGRRRSGQPRLATGAGHERQRSGVPLRHLPGRHCHPGRPAHFIRAGRPQTNGCVERVQQTILDEGWKPAFARYLIPSRPGCGWILTAISATTTPNGRTPAAGPAAAPQKLSSARPSYGSASADASPQLGDRTP
jgi:hypothetical protein